MTSFKVEERKKFVSARINNAFEEEAFSGGGDIFVDNGTKKSPSHSKEAGLISFGLEKDSFELPR